MEQESFVFYRSFYYAVKDLPPLERDACMCAIMDYALDGIEGEWEGAAKMALVFAKPQIDANFKRRRDGTKGAEHGKKGGRPKKEQSEKTPEGFLQNPIGVYGETPNGNVNVNENENGNENGNGNENENTFHPPTLSQLEAYCGEMGFQIDGQSFLDYYASNGWMVGQNPMQDWQAAVRRWEAGDRKRIGSQRQEKQPDPYGGNDFLRMLAEMEEEERREMI